MSHQPCDITASTDYSKMRGWHRALRPHVDRTLAHHRLTRYTDAGVVQRLCGHGVQRDEQSGVPIRQVLRSRVTCVASASLCVPERMAPSISRPTPCWNATCCVSGAHEDARSPVFSRPPSDERSFRARPNDSRARERARQFLEDSRVDFSSAVSIAGIDKKTSR